MATVLVLKRARQAHGYAKASNRESFMLRRPTHGSSEVSVREGSFCIVTFSSWLLALPLLLLVASNTRFEMQNGNLLDLCVRLFFFSSSLDSFVYLALVRTSSSISMKRSRFVTTTATTTKKSSDDGWHQTRNRFAHLCCCRFLFLSILTFDLLHLDVILRVLFSHRRRRRRRRYCCFDRSRRETRAKPSENFQSVCAEWIEKIYITHAHMHTHCLAHTCTRTFGFI